MPHTPENVEDVSPYKLLRNFSKSRLLRCLFLALLIHAAVIGGLSTDYIYRTWIDPQADPAEQEAAAGVEGTETPPQETGAEGTAGTPEDPAPAQPGDSPEVSGDGPPDAPVINRVTEPADPDQIPQEPGGLGLSIDDVKE
jgi:hypothetical protein